MGIQIAIIRSVAIEYLIRLVKPYIYNIGFICILLTGFVVYISYFSSQWWLLLIFPILLAAAIVACIWLALLVASKRSQQYMNNEQCLAVKSFVTKIDQLTEQIHTPHYKIIFRILRDILFRKKQGFIQQFTSDTSTLKNDYATLKKTFLKGI